MKSWKEDCLAVIPCLNEADGIAGLVMAVREHLPNVCVIDDGSSDGTSEKAGRAGAHVIRNAITCGKGDALKRGWDYGRQQGFGWTLMLDGDGQHFPGDIPGFFKVATDTGAHLVIGNRMLDAGKMPLIRRCVNTWMSRRISRRAGVDLPDTQCGFRLLNLQALNSCPLSVNHYEIESELVMQVALRGYRIAFVPIRVIYAAEASKINPLVDTIRWLRWWMRAFKGAPAKRIVSDWHSRDSTLR